MADESHLIPGLEAKIAAFNARMDARPDPALAAVTARVFNAICVHDWGKAYRSSCGRRVCLKCGFVTEKHFDALGVGEG